MQSNQYGPIMAGIDSTLPVEQRIHSFLENAPDPYHFQVGGTKVAVHYREGGTSLQQKMIQLCQEQS